MSSREEDKQIKLLHHEMLNKLSDEIHPDMGNSWKKLLNLLKVYLSSKEIREAIDIFNMCEMLEMKKEIEYGQYEVLKKLFSSTGLQKCCEIVEKYTKQMEDRRKQISSSLTRNIPVQTSSSAGAECDLPIKVDIASVSPPCSDKNHMYNIMMTFLASVLDDILKQSNTPEEKLTRFDEWLQRYERVRVERKCLMLYVRCKSKQELNDLWRIFKSGELLEILQNGLVTRDVLAKSGMKSIELTIFISEKDYDRCLKTIDDVTEQIVQVRNKGDNRCPHHQSEVTLSCIDCGGELVCDICTSTLHNGHQFVEISTIASEKKKMVQEYLEKAERKQNGMKERLQYFDDKIKECTYNFERLEIEIQMHGEKMKADIDRITKQLVAENRAVQEENMETFSKCKEGIEFVFNQLTDTMDICRKILVSENEIMTLDTNINLEKEISFPYGQNFKTAHFDAGLGIQNNCGVFYVKVVQEMKTLQEIPPRPETKYGMVTQPCYDSTILSEFSHSISITSVEKSTLDGIWVASCDDSKLYLVNLHGNILDSVSLYRGIEDISVSSDTGSLWLCLEDERAIYEISDKNLIKRFTTDTLPWNLCMTPDNNVVVGTEQRLTVYSTTGKVLHTTRNLEQQLVAVPCHITVCANTGNIAVCDLDWSEYVGKDKPHVSVFNSKLQLKYKYFGPPLSQGNIFPSEFNPVDAVYNSQGHLLIADSNSKSIQLVSGAGQFLAVVYTDVEELELVAMTLLEDNLLCVCFGSVSKVIRLQELKTV